MPDFIIQNVHLDYLIRLTASLICGLCFGIERKLRQHSVGIRTLILICMSSCLLSILSVYMASEFNIKGDPTRIAAGVITGIGFLGAGAIFHYGLNIRGLTTAAIIFTDASVGIACGANLYVPAAIVMIFSILTLAIVSRVEKKLFPAEKRKNLLLTIANKDYDENYLRETLKSCGFIIHDMDIRYSYEEKRTRLTISVHAPDSLNTNDLTEKLSKFRGIKEVVLTDN